MDTHAQKFKFLNQNMINLKMKNNSLIHVPKYNMDIQTQTGIDKPSKKNNDSIERNT